MSGVRSAPEVSGTTADSPLTELTIAEGSPSRRDHQAVIPENGSDQPFAKPRTGTILLPSPIF